MAIEKEIYELPSFEGNAFKGIVVNPTESGLSYSANILFELLGELEINIRVVSDLSLVLSGEVVLFEGEYYLGL